MGIFGKEKFNEANEWRTYIKWKIEDASKGKVNCINPNDHFNFLDDTGYKNQREVMEYDLWAVRRSNLVIVNFNDPKSLILFRDKILLHYVSVMKKILYIHG